MSFNTSRDIEGGSPTQDLHMDEAGFEVFFKKHYPRLCVYCKFRYGFDLALAEDVISTSFVKLWEVRQTLAADISPTAYLYKIINNRCLNILKHDRVKKRHLLYLSSTTQESISQASFENIDLKELRTAIDLAMGQLPEQMRKTFELSRVDGLKYAEIANQLNISVKTVETQISRALAKLRENLAVYLTFNFIVFLFNLLIKK